MSKISLKQKFDIIFVDPPFAKNEFKKEIELIKKIKIFKKDHLIIIHRESEQEELILRILSYAGVIIQDPSIIQAASQQVAVQDNNEKQ